MLQVQRNNNNQARVKAAGDTGSGGAEAGKERTQGTLCDLQITRCSDWISSTLLETCKPAPQHRHWALEQSQLYCVYNYTAWPKRKIATKKAVRSMQDFGEKLNQH